MIGRSRWNGANGDCARARRPADVWSFRPPIVPGAPKVHSSANDPMPLRMKSRRDQASAGGRNASRRGVIPVPA
jgi:hypothetical protein